MPNDSALDIRARELLAATYEPDFPRLAQTVRESPIDKFGQWFPHAITAIKAALLDPPVIDREAIRREAVSELVGELAATQAAHDRLLRAIVAAIETGRNDLLMVVRDDLRQHLSPTTSPIDQAQGVRDG